MCPLLRPWRTLRAAHMPGASCVNATWQFHTRELGLTVEGQTRLIKRKGSLCSLSCIKRACKHGKSQDARHALHFDQSCAHGHSSSVMCKHCFGDTGRFCMRSICWSISLNRSSQRHTSFWQILPAKSAPAEEGEVKRRVYEPAKRCSSRSTIWVNRACMSLLQELSSFV